MEPLEIFKVKTKIPEEAEARQYSQMLYPILVLPTRLEGYM